MSDDEELDDLFDEDLFRATSHTEVDQTIVDSLQVAKEQLRKFTVDEFIAEAFTAATNLRNIVGDADGYAFELTELIRSNLMVVVQAIKRDPGEFVLAAARTIEHGIERQTYLRNAVEKINRVIDIK